MSRYVGVTSTHKTRKKGERSVTEESREWRSPVKEGKCEYGRERFKDKYVIGMYAEPKLSPRRRAQLFRPVWFARGLIHFPSYFWGFLRVGPTLNRRIG